MALLKVKPCYERPLSEKLRMGELDFGKILIKQNILNLSSVKKTTTNFDAWQRQQEKNAPTQIFG